MSEVAPASGKVHGTLYDPAPPMGPIRSQFFITYAILSAVGVYVPILLGHWLPDHQEVKGMILALNGLAIMVSPILMAFLADAHVRVRTLLAVSFIGAGLGALALAWVDRAGRLTGLSLMVMLAASYAVYTFSVRPQSVLQDGLYFMRAHAMEESGCKPSPYALVRIFGSVGYLVPLIGLGAAAAWFGDMPMYWPMLAGAVLAFLGAVNALWLPPMDAPREEKSRGLPTLQAASQISRHRAWLFFVGMLLVQAGTVAYFSYQPQLIKDSYGMPAAWQSWVPAADVVLELVPMLAAPWLIRRVGMRRVLLWAVGAQVLRYALLAAAPSWVSPWCQHMGLSMDSWAGKCPLLAALSIKALLHGPIVIGIYVVPPMLLNQMATPSCRHSVQALFTMLAVGGGVLLGNLVQGLLAARTAPVAIFWLAAGFVAAGGLLLLLWMRRSPENVDRNAGLTPR